MSCMPVEVTLKESDRSMIVLSYLQDPASSRLHLLPAFPDAGQHEITKTGTLDEDDQSLQGNFPLTAMAYSSVPKEYFLSASRYVDVLVLWISYYELLQLLMRRMYKVWARLFGMNHKLAGNHCTVCILQEGRHCVTDIS
jgi:hypothetical protein